MPAGHPRAGGLQQAAVQVGDGDRPQQVHRLQRLRRRLPVARTTSRSSARSTSRKGREMHWLRIDRYFTRLGRRPRGGHPADRLRALRDGALRVRLPGQRHRPQRRGPERDGLQPLHRHPLLQQQLPVQGPALQLPRLHQRRQPRRREMAIEPRRHRAQPRRHGEVHLLRAAHRARAHRRPAIEGRDHRATASSRPPASRAARRRRHRLRLAQRPELEGVASCTPTRAATTCCTSSAPARAPPTWRACATPTRSSPRRWSSHGRPESRRHAGSAGAARRSSRASTPTRRSTTACCDHVWRGAGKGWWALLRRRAVDAGPASASRISWTLYKGIGVWGNNIPVGWAFGIINFVWWIGIGHAGTLISAILLLFQQKWRTSINRFAEAMTLFAVICALLFPLLHIGRPWFAAYWLLPYPSDPGHLAAVQEPAHLGRLRGLDLLHDLAAVLVPRPRPRPGGAARLVARARPSG